MLARIRGTVIHFLLTPLSLEPVQKDRLVHGIKTGPRPEVLPSSFAVAGEAFASLAVNASASVLAGLRVAFIDVRLASGPFVARVADALVHSVGHKAGGIVEASVDLAPGQPDAGLAEGSCTIRSRFHYRSASRG